MDLLERYREGHQAEVWQELRRLGDRVRDPEYLPQATAVCDEMARRARHNIETLVERLTSQMYVFHWNDDDQTPTVPFVPATDESADFADWLDQQPFGPVPLTVRSWVRLVGDVWLVGHFDDWAIRHQRGWEGAEDDDPLVIEIEESRYSDPSELVKSSYGDEYDNWQEWSAEKPEEAERFVLRVAPDRLTKGNVSGGPGYGFELPDPCADGLFRADTTMPFVEYLNRIFANGGFVECPYELRRELSRDLLLL